MKKLTPGFYFLLEINPSAEIVVGEYNGNNWFLIGDEQSYTNSVILRDFKILKKIRIPRKL